MAKKENGSEQESTSPGNGAEVTQSPKPSMVVLSPDEHAKAYPAQAKFSVFNRNDRPLNVELCAGKSQRAWHVVDGIKQLRPNTPAACLQCPGMEIGRIGPRETITVDVPLPDCMGSNDVNAKLQHDLLAIRPVVNGEAGQKIQKFEV